MKKKLYKSLNQDQISKLIKINYPFQMVDKIIKLKPSKYGIGVKNIKKNDWFFKCHLINQPLMPGTLQVEAMLQTIVCVVYANDNKNNNNFLITKSSANFFRKINSAGKLEIEVKILYLNKGILEAKATVKFKKNITSEGKFKFINKMFFKKK